MPLDAFPIVMPAAFLVVGVFMPGRGAARVAALGIAVSLLPAGLFGQWPATIAWSVLWSTLGWFVGAEDTRSSARAGAAESGAIALVIGLLALGLLLVATIRQQLSTDATLRVSIGLVFVGLGILQLMLRRNVIRAASAFGALGLGLHVLLDAARRASVGGGESGWFGVPLASALAAVLAIRLGTTRREVAGSAAVSDAHDLHD